MKKALAPFLVLAAASAHAQVPVNLATWNFNDSNLTVDSGITAAASFLRVVAGPTGGATPGFVSGNASGATVAGNAVGLTTFPAQGAGSDTAGIRANVSTVGLSQVNYDRIRVSLDWQTSNTASRRGQFAYTTDGGTNWTNVAQAVVPGAGTFSTFRPTSYTGDGTSFVINDPLAYGNANFGIRFLSIFDTGTSYVAANTAGGFSYGPTGTWRFDNVTVEAVPEPASMAVLALGLASLKRRRKG